MPPKGHALLSASSSDRWLHCPPSARLCESYEDKGSDYAAEGTDAHALCEYKLRKALGMEATIQPKVSTGTTPKWKIVPQGTPALLWSFWKMPSRPAPIQLF